MLLFYACLIEILKILQTCEREALQKLHSHAYGVVLCGNKQHVRDFHVLDTDMAEQLCTVFLDPRVILCVSTKELTFHRDFQKCIRTVCVSYCMSKTISQMACWKEHSANTESVPWTKRISCVIRRRNFKNKFYFKLMIQVKSKCHQQVTASICSDWELLRGFTHGQLLNAFKPEN